MRIVLASGNRHKAEELTRLLPGMSVEPYAGELPPETGSSFLENALIKARAVHEALGGEAWVLADDSGIEARALGGVPGIRSARYAGDGATDEQNLRKLLDALAEEDDRAVAYVAELVAIAPDGETRTVAEMSAAEKDAISHRARAAEGLRELLP